MRYTEDETGLLNNFAVEPEMYDEYETICRKYGVQPRQTKNLGTACVEMFDFIFQLNDPNRNNHITNNYLP